MTRLTDNRTRPMRGSFPPVEGESFHSWMVRLAHFIGVPLTALFLRLGLRDWQIQGRGTSVYGVRLSDADADRLSQATGVPVDVIRSTELLRYADVIDLSAFQQGDPSSLRLVAASSPLTPRTWRVCPDCLAADGVVRLSGHLAATFLCPVHEKRLVEVCPSCLGQIGLGRVGRHFPSKPSQVPVPGRCTCLVRTPGAKRKSRYREACGFDLTDLARSGTPVDAGQLDAALMIDGWLHGVAGEFPAKVMVAGFHAFAALHAYADGPGDVVDDTGRFEAWSERRDAGDQTAVINWSTEPRSVDVMAAVAPGAVRDLMVAISGDTGTTLTELADRVCARRRRLHHKVSVEQTGFGLPLELQPAWREACRKVQPGFVSARRRDRRWQIGTDHIPALLPDHLFAPFENGILEGLADDTAREFAALTVAKLVCEQPWSVLGDALGYPPGEAENVVSFSTRKVREHGTRDLVWAAAEVVADGLETAWRGPEQWTVTVYGPARWYFADWADMGPDLWSEVVALTGVHPGRTAARRRNATAYAWAYKTGGHPHWSPALQPTAGGPSVESLREDYRRFVRTMPDNVRDALREVWMLTDFEMEPQYRVERAAS